LNVKTDDKIANNILELIGNTPMVRLNKVTENSEAEVIAKLEMFNPTSSVKDRVGIAMIEDAEKRGLLTPNKSTIIEPTSGNTGIGLALASSIKGYSCIIVMPDSMSIERRKILMAMGAKIVLTPGKEGFKGAIEKTEELLLKTPNSWSPMQFENSSNPLIHKETTGKEIWNDMGGDIDIFVCGLGTGGTLTGVAEYLKSKNKSIKIVAVEPLNCSLLSGGEAGLHKIQGLLGGFIAPTTNVNIIDDVIAVSDEDAFNMARRLTREEGLFVGISSGAAAYGALQIARKIENKGKRIVVLLPDTGERYLSSELWDFLS